MTTITGNIYDYPKLYDVLFSDLCDSEIKFFTSAFERYCKKKTGSVFEPACGSGRLLYRLAKLGFDVAGLDLNSRAAAFCNQRLKRYGLRESAVIGNMANFSLSDLGRRKKFDLAFNFVSSFLHLTAETDARQHLHRIAEVLNKNGIYLLGIHLKPKGKSLCAEEHWSMNRGTLSVKSRLRSLSQDTKTRIEMIEFQIEAETPKKRYKIVDRFPFRIYSAKQFYDLLKAVNRFDVLETYSFDYDINHPLKVESDTEDVVFVLKKRE